MSITLDDNAVDVFKLYDELAIAYSKDIDGYKALVKAIEAMIAQKEETLQDIKNKTIHLIINSISSPVVLPVRKASLRRPVKKFNYAGVDEEDLKPGNDIELKNAVVDMSGVIPEKEKSQDLNAPQTSAKVQAYSAKESNWNREKKGKES